MSRLVGRNLCCRRRMQAFAGVSDSAGVEWAEVDKRQWGPSRSTVENLALEREVVAVGDDASPVM